MKSSKYLILAAGVLCAFQASAFANMVQGKVVSADIASMTVKVRESDAATGKAAEKSYLVTPKTSLKGLHNLSELKTGEKIAISGQAGPMGKWEALSIEVQENTAKK